MDFPVLPQEVQVINVLLTRHFGIDTESQDPIWRVSWSTDQFEKRLTDCTPEGFFLIRPEVLLLPKYQYCKDRWILERLCAIPDIQLGDLPSQKKSYENMYTFENSHTGGPIQPSFEACKFVVDLIYASMGKKSMRKYVDEEAANPIESRNERINKLTEELFGDESDLLGRTITGEAVAYTGKPTIQPVKE